MVNKINHNTKTHAEDKKIIKRGVSCIKRPKIFKSLKEFGEYYNKMYK